MDISVTVTKRMVNPNPTNAYIVRIAGTAVFTSNLEGCYYWITQLKETLEAI